jgi:hypothetical protein
MITLLAYYERISLFHTMEPFFLKKIRPRFYFTSSPEYCLAKDKNRILFMERWFQHREPRDLEPEDLEFIKKLRDKYKTIVFFNGQPEAGTNRLDLLPWVDRLFYKSVFSDAANYQKDLYAKNLFAHYYHDKYGVSDGGTGYRYTGGVDDGNLKKAGLSWNIGVGSYPRKNLPQRLGVLLARGGFPDLRSFFAEKRAVAPKDFSSPGRSIEVHARIDPVPSASISFQRRLFLDLIKGDRRFLTGLVSQAAYYRELEDSKIVLSPFGWGEVCFRDFEAVISGSLLFKPDMSHLKTWPDVYIPYETYVPLDWDGGDLMDKALEYLENDAERERISKNAYEQYRSELGKLEARFVSLLGEVLDNGH